VLIAIYIALEFMKGSKRFKSVVGIPVCSPLYWIINAAIIVLALTFFVSYLFIRREEQAQVSGDNALTMENIESHERMLITNSIGAGLISGLGLGGGILIVPLYRELGLTTVQAASTSAFTVFVTSGINTIQAVFLGVLNL